MMKLYDNKYAYNADSNIWQILLSRGVRITKQPDFYIENGTLSLIYRNVQCNYDDTQMYKHIYDACHNIEMYYKYKFIACNKIDDSRGFKLEFEIKMTAVDSCFDVGRHLNPPR